MAKNHGGQENRRKTESERRRLQAFFWQRREAEVANLFPSLKTCWPKITIRNFWTYSTRDRRRRENEIKYKLITIHPNPGPRDKSDEGKRKRRERRYAKRKEKREAKEKSSQDKHLNIITWNVQGMSVGTHNKRKLKSVAAYVNKNKWDAALLTEVRAKDSGTVWLGEGLNLVAVRYTKRAAILLRGRLLKKWCEEGQRSEEDARTITIKIGELALVSTYLPVYKGNNAQEIEEERHVLKTHIERISRSQILVVGGDFNAHVGAGEDRPGTCGKFGIGISNQQGRDFLEWLEENNLCHINSFYQHQRRGTWFSVPLQRWFEIDGFIMRNDQRHRFVRKICTVGEASLSDHKPKKIKIETQIKKKSWTRQKPKKRPRIVWEKLRNDQTATTYKQRVDELLAEEAELEIHAADDTGDWDLIAKTVTKAAEEVCGVEEKFIENAWMVGREEEINTMTNEITAAINQRNDLMERYRIEVQNRDNLTVQIEAAKNRLKTARKTLKRTTTGWERDYWETIIQECKEAGESYNTSQMYKSLKKLGTRGQTKSSATTKLTKDDFKVHFSKISANRFENNPEEIDEVVNKINDIRNTEEARTWNQKLNELPTSQEIFKEMDLMRESAPGEDNVRLIYLQKAGPEMKIKVTKMIQYMFTHDATDWKESLKAGIVIPLYKRKGDKDVEGNYRGVCLLAMASRILARVLASRLREWAEEMKLMDDDQSGFRKGRATADVSQIMFRIQEDTEDLEKRIDAAGEQFPEEERPTARLLDLKKAYPRVNKYALWAILERYGLKGNFLKTIQNLHETTVYKVQTREGESKTWLQERGLREGCPSSPILFNIFHQVVMRLAASSRKRKAEEQNMEAGITFSWVPGSYFPSEHTWEKYNSEAKKVKLDKALFADDTTLAGKKKEIEQGVAETKKIINCFEERNNDEKEETLDFGTEDSKKIRMLGSWMGWEEDLSQRVKRAGAAWAKVRNRLKGSKLSKKTQARIVEACVESTLLFDCQARTWRKGELKRLQQFMDKRYRTIWARRHTAPLIQMQERQKNMQDVRNELGVKSIRWKVEKRVLERIGHIFRMPDDRMVKVATLGWLEDLEGWNKVPGKKRKTVLYWKGLIKEAGWDWTRVGDMSKDRKAWKSKVMERMKHVEDWEKKGGKSTLQSRGPRNSTPEETSLTCEECNKVCKSKAGLTNHIKRMHNISSQKTVFKCENCNEEFNQKANLINHKKKCTGEVQEASKYVPKYVECDLCGIMKSASNLSRHRKVCPNNNNGD